MIYNLAGASGRAHGAFSEEKRRATRAGTPQGEERRAAAREVCVWRHTHARRRARRAESPPRRGGSREAAIARDPKGKNDTVRTVRVKER